MPLMEAEWISTGVAAKMIGYSRDGFRRKFRGSIQWIRIGNGHYHWNKAQVESLHENPMPSQEPRLGLE